MEIRGYDSYDVTLGDELRGERATRGWTVRDAARELCIRPELIQGIENADLSVFPNRSVVPGYVRSYARYLGRDPEEMFARFCAESGFQSTLVTFGMRQETGARAKGETGLGGSVGADFTASRFAVRAGPRRIGARIPLGALVSGAALLALVAGVGYGGWAVLQDIQRVGFAPLPDAPAVVADAPVIVAPSLADVRRVEAAAYAPDGALLGLGAPERVRLVGRDGPIAAIDPERAGLVHETQALHASLIGRVAVGQARVAVPPPAAAASPGSPLDTDVAVARAEPFGPPAPTPEDRVEDRVEAPAQTSPAPVEVDPVPDAPPKIAVVVTTEVWMRLRDGAGATLFVGTLRPGERFEVPERVEGVSLRAGNAHGVFVEIDGTRHGPLGGSGAVVSRVSLAAEDVAAAYAVVEPDAAPEGRAIRAAAAD